MHRPDSPPEDCPASTSPVHFATQSQPHHSYNSTLSLRTGHTTCAMVLQDLGRRINAAVTNLTRDQNLDEKVRQD